MSATFQVRGYAYLLALHRVIMEAKFSPTPNDFEITISPFVAEIANQVVETLIEMENERGNQERAKDWNKWRKIDPSRREWQIALERAKRDRKWLIRSPDDKKRYVSITLSPFVVSEDLMMDFIVQAEHE